MNADGTYNNEPSFSVGDTVLGGGMIEEVASV